MFMTFSFLDAAQQSAVDAILSRTSVRSYDPEKTVSDEQVEILLRAAMSAPTAMNKQPWAFIVVRDKTTLAALAAELPYAKMLPKAQLAIVPCGDSSKFLHGEDDQLWVQDLSAAAENILVAANAIGLGGVWTSVYPHKEREEPVEKILNLPKGIIPLTIIPIGYPGREYSPRDKWNPDVVHHEHW